ncbi:helix-turn-helix transcriptional regulator [Oscillibacter sp.]|nr:helix-turn-helix transcriptional regulator [Oscillibacter sp.]
MTVGEKIKVLRQREKWSQKRLAFELGVSETTIRNYELGHGGVRERHLVKLSELFHIDISVLRDNSVEKYTDVMQLLFMLADEQGLVTSDIEHVLPDDSVLVFNNRTLQAYINTWHKKRSTVEAENLPKEEIQAWELRFPESYAEDCEQAIKDERNRSSE